MIRKQYMKRKKKCHALWFTGRCSDQKTCLDKHVRHPNFESYDPFRLPDYAERKLQEYSEIYEIPVDRRHPRKEKKSFPIAVIADVSVAKDRAANAFLFFLNLTVSSVAKC